jgi:hypothetical protein
MALSEGTPAPQSPIQTDCNLGLPFEQAKPGNAPGFTQTGRCATWDPNTERYAVTVQYALDDQSIDPSFTFNQYGTTILQVTRGSLTVTIVSTCALDGFCDGTAQIGTKDPQGPGTDWSSTATPTAQLPGASFTLNSGDSIILTNVTITIAVGAGGADIDVFAVFPPVPGGCSGTCFHMP